MKTVLRTFAAVVTGLLVLFVLLIAVEFFSAVVHPFPEGFKETTEEICRHVERYPQWVLAVVVPAWAAAAFASTVRLMRLRPLMSTIAGTITMSDTPTKPRTSLLASVETMTFGIPSGNARIAAVAIDVPAPPPSAMIASTRPRA